jgi:hypothetical protein
MPGVSSRDAIRNGRSADDANARWGEAPDLVVADRS